MRKIALFSQVGSRVHKLTGNMHTHSLHKSAIGGQHRAFRLSHFLLDLVLAGWRYMSFARRQLLERCHPDDAIARVYRRIGPGKPSGHPEFIDLFVC